MCIRDRDGKPALSRPNSIKGLAMYAGLLKDYGPPGALNHTFTQSPGYAGNDAKFRLALDFRPSTRAMCCAIKLLLATSCAWLAIMK